MQCAMPAYTLGLIQLLRILPARAGADWLALLRHAGVTSGGKTKDASNRRCLWSGVLGECLSIRRIVRPSRDTEFQIR